MGAGEFIQRTLPDPLLVPTAELIVYRLPRREVLGQHPPLAAAFCQVEDRIHNLPFIVLGRPTSTACYLEMMGNAAPLLFA